MKSFKKAVCLILCTLLLTVSIPAAAADESGCVPERISVCVNGDMKASRGICWYTDSNTDTKVQISENGVDVTEALGIDVSCDAWEGKYVHKATVTGLRAGTEYTYKVGNGEVFSDYGTFTTDDGDSSLSFIAISDVQASSKENFEKGAATLEAAFSKQPDAQFALNCGDFTNDSTNEEWDLYDESFGALNRSMTLAPVSGNHDGLGVWHWFDNMFNLDTSESVQTLNGVNYSFDCGNAHIAVLNTNDLLSISLAQLDWLRNDMNSTSADWKIVAMHKSPYTLGKDGKWPDALYLQDSLTRVMDSCNVDLVFSGHDHMYLRTKALKNNAPDDSGTVYVLAGTAGSKRYEARKFLVDSFLKTENIGALTIQKDGYGNYWNGSDFDSVDSANVGGCFSTVNIDGGSLTLNAYILSDADATVKCVDTLTLTKQTGLNTPTFSGSNTASTFKYAASVIPSLACLAAYAFMKWLPKFIFISPKILDSVINEDTF